MSQPSPPPAPEILELPFTPPYDWAHVAGFLAARAIPGVEHVTPSLYARTIALDGAHGTVAVRPHPSRPALVAEVRFPDAASLPLIGSRLRRVFDLDADPGAIVTALGRDPRMASLVAHRPGLRVPGAWDGFELAVRGILGQQISVSAATALAGKLVALCGTGFSGDQPDLPGLTHVFPLPRRVAGAGDLGLALGMPRRRAAAIVGIAAAAAEDPGLFEPGGTLTEAITRLRALPGIGEWTAHYIAMRALRQADAFPAADIGLLRALETEAGRPTPAALLLEAETWRPWRSYAALHLWAADASRAAAVRPPAAADPASPRDPARPGRRTRRYAGRQ
jgi:3-methyladenine DNA glycosylase/8-oxoguanine DNA glycosylase